MRIPSWSRWLGVAVFMTSGRGGLAAEVNVPIVFTGGHETDRRDGGRPVVLIAAGLGVPADVFRKAFRGVTPSRSGPPSREQAQRNKRALLKVLGPLGVSNDRLDEVSNYYRYRPQNGELWRVKPAAAHAVVIDGAVTQVVLTDPGAGYSSPPRAAIEGRNQTPLEVKLHFDKDLQKNGSIASIEISPSNRAARPDPKP